MTNYDNSLLINRDNNEWDTNVNHLILGQPSGLYDSINTHHPKCFQLYKLQKSIDWAEDELNLSASRADMLTCPKGIKDIMLYNIAYQWEIDSIASRTFAVIFAPFITNSEFWASLLKNTEVEVTHALTYSEIVHQCVPNPKDIFKLVLENKHIEERSSLALTFLQDVKIAGAQLTLNLIKNDQELFDRVFLGLVAMYVMERLSFMSSFATTFACAEQGYFLAICKLVQKIAIDEITCHAELVKYVLQYLIEHDPRAHVTMERYKTTIENLVTESEKKEFAWSQHIFSGNRKMVGVNAELTNDWVKFNGLFVRRNLGLSSSSESLKNPLTFMDKWLNIDSQQNAMQEADGNNYLKNSLVDDLSDTVLDY